MPEKLKVIVRNKTSKYLESDCFSVSMVNHIGPFDILPEHANFVSIVFGELSIIQTSGKVWKKECIRGIARAVNNVVDVVILEEKL